MRQPQSGVRGSSATHRPRVDLDLPTRYVALEELIGHRFKAQFTLAEVVAEAARIEAGDGPLV